MPKKIDTVILGFFIGMLAVLMVIKIASAGYKFGQYLAPPKAHKYVWPSIPVEVARDDSHAWSGFDSNSTLLGSIAKCSIS
jgi:hypothetical protein